MEIVQFVYPSEEHFLAALCADGVEWTLEFTSPQTELWRQLAFQALTHPAAFIDVDSEGLVVRTGTGAMIYLTIRPRQGPDETHPQPCS